MGMCMICFGEGIVDEGTSEERECPFCCGTGFSSEEDDDNNESNDDG